MPETPYANRELDEKFLGVHDKLDKIVEQTTATNGKVRKIIMAIILLSGVSLGLGLEQAAPLLSLFL